MLKRFLIGTVVLTCSAVTVYASADLCKAPVVKVINEKANTIKVKRIRYFDGCDRVWREELINDVEILPPDSDGTRHVATIRDDLEYVGNCKIEKFQLYRAVRQNKGGAYGKYEWGGDLVPDEGSKICNTGVTYTIRAHD